ncbi:hypothetical protein PR048_017674 [Dryococelus australis]|uniref:DDE Tnp4 domain-containing protein n=1 Tax=Dryococelus australis TaxID=614101 RepID=A0ABQ9HAC6_9NEOP|nr:hypothetical protein PR048_017674 [Dryococelus australis]
MADVDHNHCFTFIDLGSKGSQSDDGLALENSLILDGGFLVVLNFRISRVRRIVQNAFGIFVSRFRVFDTKLSCKLPTVNKLVRAACALHNWLWITSTATHFPRGAVDDEYFDSAEVIPGRW